MHQKINEVFIVLTIAFSTLFLLLSGSLFQVAKIPSTASLYEPTYWEQTEQASTSSTTDDKPKSCSDLGYNCVPDSGCLFPAAVKGDGGCIPGTVCCVQEIP